jgi:nicotinate-nucleotide pyrophosphorylase (carboxylating)
MNYTDPTLELRIEQVKNVLPGTLRHPAVIQILKLSLAEDLHPEADFHALWPNLSVGDSTSLATLAPDTWLSGQITSKAWGIIAGLPVVEAICLLIDPQIACKPFVKEGSTVQAGTLLAEISGPGLALLAVERPMLNFLGRLSGIASLTHKFVKAVAGTKAVILDTRKTAPGLRHLDKYAVQIGGGQNHRTGLFDMIMIKDNHIDGAGGILEAVDRVRQRFGGKYLIEVEVKNLEELKTAMEFEVDRIMLDNMSLEMMREAVNMVGGRIPLEASGNVTLPGVAAIAKTGVDFISSGSLTHSAPVLDISMRLR